MVRWLSRRFLSAVSKPISFKNIFVIGCLCLLTGGFDIPFAIALGSQPPIFLMARRRFGYRPSRLVLSRFCKDGPSLLWQCRVSQSLSLRARGGFFAGPLRTHPVSRARWLDEERSHALPIRIPTVRKRIQFHDIALRTQPEPGSRYIVHAAASSLEKSRARKWRCQMLDKSPLRCARSKSHDPRWRVKRHREIST